MSKEENENIESDNEHEINKEFGSSNKGEQHFQESTENTQEKPEITKNKKMIAWLKRLGLLGFLFFLIKGLVWLAVIFFGGSKLLESCN